MENMKHCYIAIGLLYLSNQKKQQSLRFKFAEVNSHLWLRKCKKLRQTYRKLADLRLRTTHCYFCGICGCGIECKFAAPSTAIRTSNVKRERSLRIFFLSRKSLVRPQRRKVCQNTQKMRRTYTIVRICTPRVDRVK